MGLYKNTLYHVYNQGNNKENIFKEKEDFQLFLPKLEAFVHPNCKLLCYCLMPNHFHFFLLTTEKSVEEIRIGSLIQSQLTNGLRLLLSGYAHEFNKSIIGQVHYLGRKRNSNWLIIAIPIIQNEHLDICWITRQKITL